MPVARVGSGQGRSGSGRVFVPGVGVEECVGGPEMVASLPGQPTSRNPIGKPSTNPAGMLMAGKPSQLNMWAWVV